MDPSLVTSAPTNPRAFTLLELLVVIAILGILAALSVPVLKNFGKSDATLSASRQLLDDVGRARQLAISQRTTVCMVFVPPNFWSIAGPFPNSWWTTPAPGLTLAQRTAATNLCDKQFTGYNFISLRSVGDQPGNPTMRYLDRWQTLPDGTFIPTNKFVSSGIRLSWSQVPPGPLLYDYWNQDYRHPDQNEIRSFHTNDVAFPFPTADSPNKLPLPYIAFNYLGQLATNSPNGVFMSAADEYIPIAKGSVIYAKDVATRQFQFALPDALETPAGNSTNIAYNIVHIDRLTGRAVLEFHKVK